MYQVHVYKFVQLIKKGEIANYQVKVKFYFERSNQGSIQRSQL